MEQFSTTDLEAADSIISALDSRLRVLIILKLAKRDHFVHELVSSLEKSQPLISQHLRVLKRSGIVDSERRGREVVYRLAQEGAADLIAAAVALGRPIVREGEGADVISLDRGKGTRAMDEGGQLAHAPAAISQDVVSDTVPDPSPTPPLPRSFT